MLANCRLSHNKPLSLSLGENRIRVVSTYQQRTIDLGRCQAGGSGNLPALSDSVSGMYSISVFSDRAYLDVAVLVTLVRQYRISVSQMKTRPHSSPPLPQGGGGAAVGPYMLIFSNDDNGLCVYGVRLLIVGDDNVIFLREDDNQRMLHIAGQDRVDDELGSVEWGAAGPIRLIRLAHVLTERVVQMPSVSSFLRAGD